ncbi:unnamed protein product [Ceratitis capitata]|uniref:(Mediterranean fruit fly) hypothetical protein n=1 Tax=Ceratitis capitata TaxID=7213 RepID=A0A811UDM2_CERCA|nr:unnamed protein product [Ceratitis capitata]
MQTHYNAVASCLLGMILAMWLAGAFERKGATNTRPCMSTVILLRAALRVGGRAADWLAEFLRLVIVVKNNASTHQHYDVVQCLRRVESRVKSLRVRWSYKIGARHEELLAHC